jgi:hypothetical protein
VASHSRQPPGHPRRSVATLAIGEQEADLQVRGERYFLSGAGGSEQELTQAEAEQLSRHADNLTARAESRGLLLADSPVPTTSWLSELRQKLPSDRLTVLVDTTTIYNAGEALHTRGRAPSPIALLDLSVLTAAATLFDTIVIQPERFPPLEEIRDLTEVLQPTEEAHQLELERIYEEVWDGFNRPRELSTYAARWAKFLAVTADDLRLDLDPVRTLNEEMTCDYSSTAEITEAFGIAGGPAGREEQLAVALGIHTVRTGFNDAIAGALGLPYLATSVRLPISSRLANSKTDVLRVLRELIANSNPPGPSEPAMFAPRTQIAAPLLLGLVLEQMSKPEDYRAALDDIRQRFAPLRAELRDDRETAPWDEKPGRYLQRFTKHLGGTGPLAPAQDVLAGAAQPVATFVAGDPGFTTAALKAIMAVKPLDMAHRAYLRLWRPEIYVLLNVAQEAGQLSRLNSRIRRIWGSELDLTQQDLLERFANLRADPFLTPTALA